MTHLSLKEVCVLDLTRLLPGPYASLVLADLGATVVKIEQPGTGDPLRHLLASGADGNSVLFELVNRGKKSMTLNLKDPKGRAILLGLARDADVMLEGFRPGVTKRLGLDYETLQEVNPRLIYASLSGYGQTGPYASRAGHDLNYVGLGGLLGITGIHDGRPPIPAVPFADLVGGLWMAVGVVAALFERQRTGRGQYLDISMLDGVASLLPVPLAEWLMTGQVPGRSGMHLRGGQACYNVYETSDGQHVTVAALESKFWSAFCAAVGREDWVERQNDADQAGLIAELAALFRSQPRSYWTELFAQHDCCCEPVLGLDEVFAHPQAVHRGLLHEDQLALPLGGRGAAHPPAPQLGEHTAELLAQLGYAMVDVVHLRESGAI
ncbi:MAG TPA: CaiB/BaiF CoA-transferase family protein [Anaerolineae bacterium]|nr:CaiB/BaiF CoA-transferase family protein [Anaerolineae bacterium]